MKQRQVLNNAKWIIICKVAQSILQLIVGMFCARYLGPSNYGLINYASSIVAFALPIMKLGLDATLVRELVDDPENEGEIMGTSLMMNAASSIVCIMGIAAFASIANAGEGLVIIVCILYSISLIFAALEMIQYWFQYKLLSKYPSIIMLISYVVVSLYKIFLLITSKSLYWFAITNSIDYGIIGITLIVIYNKKSNQRLKISFRRVGALFQRSKYYIFAALMLVVYQNTDHIMLKMMIGNDENGFYTAAITSATVLQFVYTAIIDSYRPMILSFKKENEQLYEKNVSSLYSITFYMTIAQSVVFFAFARLIINILYGAEYAPSIVVLRILIWYIVFAIMGTVRNVWILAEGKQKILPVINCAGALINIVLNFLFIPSMKASGAAFASFLTQFLMNFILGFIMKSLRKNNELLLKGMNPIFFIHESKKFVKMICKK